MTRNLTVTRLHRGDVITNTWRHLVVESVTVDGPTATVVYRYVGDTGRVTQETWRTPSATTVTRVDDHLGTDPILDAVVGLPVGIAA